MDAEIRRTVLRKLTYGMYIMTASAEGKVAASTLTWLSQCSFHPPLVMIGIQRRSPIHDAVEKSGAIAVSILGEGQKEIAERFFHAPTLDGDRLNGFAYEPGPSTGAPLLTDLPAWFEARVTDSVQRGDHTVFIAEVINAGVRNAAAAPLLLATTPWNYGG